MADMSVPVGPAPAAGAGGILQQPRVLLIGGAGLLAAVMFVYLRRGGGAPSSDGTTADAGVAGPNAALAIGSLESRLKETSGRLEEQLAGQQDAYLGALSGAQSSLTSLIDTSSQGLLASQRDLDFWQTAQRRGEQLNLQRAADGGWTPDQERYNLWNYARGLVLIRPDLESYYTDWLSDKGVDFDTGEAISS